MSRPPHANHGQTIPQLRLNATINLNACFRQIQTLSRCRTPDRTQAVIDLATANLRLADHDIHAAVDIWDEIQATARKEEST